MQRSLWFHLAIGTLAVFALGWLITYPSSCLTASYRMGLATGLAVLSGWSWCISAYFSILGRPGARGQWLLGSIWTNLIAAFAALLTGLVALFQHPLLPGLCG
jgi:hypothetical protein